MASTAEQGDGVDRTSEEGCDGDSRAAVFYRLRHLLGLVSISVLQYGIVAPSIQFVILTFFAAWHGGDDCELTPSSEPCRRAAANFAVYRGVSMGISGLLGFGTALIFGSYSDTIGRRPFLRAKSVFSVAPIAALAYHVFFDGSLWLYLVLAPLYDAFDINGVFLGYMSDVIAEPKLRTAAYGALSIIFIASIGLVLWAGGTMSVNVAIYVALVVCVLKVVFVYTLFPESSLRTKTETPLPGTSEVFANAVEIFFRNSFISRMAVILMVSGLSAAGFGTIAPSYFTAYLDVDKREGAQLLALWAVSVIFALIVVLPWSVHFLGEVGTMKLSLLATVVQPPAIMLCTRIWEVYPLIFVLGGCMALTFPVVSAIKSNLVDDDEQGLLQGALAATRVVAEAIAYFFFGSFYYYSTRGGKGERSSAFPAFAIVTILAVVALGIACTLPSQPPPPSKREKLLMSSDAGSPAAPFQKNYSSA